MERGVLIHRYRKHPETYTEKVNEKLYMRFAWLLRRPKLAGYSVLHQIWLDKNYKTEEKTVWLENCYEVVDELVSRERLILVDLARRHRNLFPDNITIWDEFKMMRQSRDLWAELTTSVIPICMETMFLVKVSMEVFELRLNAQSPARFNLSGSPLNGLTPATSSNIVRATEKRKMAVSMEQLKVAVASKYLMYEGNARLRMDWNKLYKFGDLQIKVWREQSKNVSSEEISAFWIKYKAQLNESRTRYKDLSRSDFTLRLK